MDHQFWMRRCLDLARRGAGKVSPNPLVGAVIVYENKAIGEGWHQNYGGPHAEINALESVRHSDAHLIKDSTMYVNLEPCHHYGNTPPCSLRIHKEGMQKLVIGSIDPDPRVAGNGAQFLREKGVKVTAGVLQTEAEYLNRFFYTFHNNERPYVILKWAESMDGYIGLKGKRTPITDRAAQIEVHRWRAETDAILVGARTANIDDPSLTERWHGGLHPLRIAIDENAEITRDIKLLNDELPVWIFSRKEAPFPLRKEKQWFKIDETNEIIDGVLSKLYENKFNSLLIEGGKETLARWMKTEKWDEARYIRSDKELREGIRAPIVKGKLIDRYMAGSDEITILHRPK